MQHYVSLCAIAKNEDELLRNWVSYHLLLGVDHIYIYDNESKNPIANLLRDHIENGQVTLYEVKGSCQHINANEHCIKNHKDDSRWIGFIDIDEYVFIKKKYSLPLLLMQYEEYPGLCINWATFGSGYEISAVKKNIFIGDRYHYRYPKKHHVNIHVKTFVNPTRVQRFSTTHNAVYFDDAVAVNSARIPVRGPFSPVHVEDVQINHYLFRSQEQYMAKAARGRSDVTDAKNEDQALEEFIRQTKEAVVFDDGMSRQTKARRAADHAAQACDLGAKTHDCARLERRVAKALRLGCPVAAQRALSVWRLACQGEPGQLGRVWRAAAKVLLAFQDFTAARQMIVSAMRASGEVDNYLVLSEILEAQGELVAALTATYCVAEYVDVTGRVAALQARIQQQGGLPE